MFSLHSPSVGVNWYTATLLGGIFLIIAGFFDAIDGTVARVTKKTSALGSFLDSIIDKVSEIVIFIGILIGNFTNPVLVLVTLSLSILVSYTRARAESMGIDLKGKGIAERAERILILSILAFIPFRDNISLALWIISVLAIITILERLKIVSAVFGVSLFSIQAFSQIFKRDSMTGSTYSTSGSQNTTKFDNDKPTSSSTASTASSKSGASASSRFSDSVRDILHKPDTKKDEKLNEETKPYKTEKANFLDKTDPNEMGRNTDQIIFELENEDKKMQSNKSPPPSSTSSSSASSTADSSKPENKDNKTTASTTTTSSTKSTDTTSNPSDSEVNENTKESDKNSP
jgi:archaetidylinositol phosphate synthase